MREGRSIQDSRNRKSESEHKNCNERKGWKGIKNDRTFVFAAGSRKRLIVGGGGCVTVNRMTMEVRKDCGDGLLKQFLYTERAVTRTYK